MVLCTYCGDISQVYCAGLAQCTIKLDLVTVVVFYFKALFGMRGTSSLKVILRCTCTNNNNINGPEI